MKQYIIKNCPAYDNRIWQEPTCNINTLDCKDITDCLLKQIVDECREQNLKYDTTACSVLELLEIEECE